MTTERPLDDLGVGVCAKKPHMKTSQELRRRARLKIKALRGRLGSIALSAVVERALFKAASKDIEDIIDLLEDLCESTTENETT